MTPKARVRAIVPDSLIPILTGIYAWEMQGWIGGIVTYVALIGLIGLLLGVAERGGWSMRTYLRARFAMVFACATLVAASGMSLCDTSLTACSTPLF